MKADITKATPRPWLYEVRTPNRTCRAAIEDKISCDDFPFVIWIPDPPFALGACGMLIARREGFSAKAGEAEANAALIVVAVNSYDTAQKLAEAVLHEHATPNPKIVARCEGVLCDLAREFKKAGGE